MGDPAGIGPEVTLAAIADPAVRRALQPILVGCADVFTAAARRTRGALPLRAWQPGEPISRTTVPVYAVANLPPRARIAARPTAAGGRAAYAAIVAAAGLVRDGGADALTTAPISKANLAAAGCGAGGHTELLAELAGGAEVRMMMIAPNLRVALVTTHLAIADVARRIDRRAVRDTIRIVADTLRRHFALPRPRIAVAGLNPHAGERGLYGREEIESIGPAAAQARRSGIDAIGPLAADSAFPLALRGRYDAVVCMYHDQALAPFKLLHFHDGVNFTAGLPWVRTSPDHGTAYDIAGRNRADPTSMISALLLAAATQKAPRPQNSSALKRRRLETRSHRARRGDS